MKNRGKTVGHRQEDGASWWTTREAKQAGCYSQKKLTDLFIKEIIPAIHRNGERPWYVRPWIMNAHIQGYNVSKVKPDITREEFEKIFYTLKRG